MSLNSEFRDLIRRLEERNAMSLPLNSFAEVEQYVDGLTPSPHAHALGLAPADVCSVWTKIAPVARVLMKFVPAKWGGAYFVQLADFLDAFCALPQPPVTPVVTP